MRRIALLAGLLLATAPAAAKIDRHALVSRHDVRLRAIDPHAAVMLGNGELGFVADVTGLQTFPDAYAPQSPLLTMAQWAWHSFPNPKGWTEADGSVQVPVPGRGRQPYAYFTDFKRMGDRPALAWLRENPHRFSLARVSLRLVRRDGTRATPADLRRIDQRLDMWRGVLVSRFVFEGAPMSVETRVDTGSDAVLAEVRSPLVASGRVGVDVAFPGVSARINPDPSDWDHPDRHRTEVTAERPGAVALARTIDAVRFGAGIVADGGSITRSGPHGFRVEGRGGRLRVSVRFDRPGAAVAPAMTWPAAAARADAGWRRYWSDGGMVSFAGSTDPRAAELERRVVLSQYLARVNQAGSFPAQEEGLYSNSWNGKFHHEMIGWHAGHFATWGRPALLAPTMRWLEASLSSAQARARRHGVDGAWWPKMTGPDGSESPSPVNPFIMWQQPHPVWLAELMRRAEGDAAAARYRPLVEQTARLLASWPLTSGERYHLGPPIIPVQENHPPLTTADPAFELEYWRWALGVAQTWRERAGAAREPLWDRVAAGLPDPPAETGLYLPVPGATGFWRDAAGRCRGDATVRGCLNRDHPSFLMALGLMRGPRTDPETMRRTLAAVRRDWDLRQTWGWDFPMIAMTAARLGDPEAALDWLFADQVNNRWGPTGMTPRVEVEPHATGGPDGPGYRRMADTYFPSNGALLLAVGMMAGGWDGSRGHAPGFPAKGWRVEAEGLVPLP